MKAELTNRYPELLEKAVLPFGIECNSGWFNLIDAICYVAYQPLLDIRWRMGLYKDEPEKLEQLHKQHQEEIQKLPKIAQIKEKFGTLRFYADNLNDAATGAIILAKKLSSVTCEDCGNVGEQRSVRGWISTSCRDCAVKRYSEEEISKYEEDES